MFPQFHNSLQLTQAQLSISTWKLPQWLYPKSKEKALSYYKDLRRWEKQRDHILLKTANRGQEFVLDCQYYPEAIEWIKDLICNSSHPN